MLVDKTSLLNILSQPILLELSAVLLGYLFIYLTVIEPRGSCMVGMYPSIEL